MRINSVSPYTYKQSFGVQYSDEVIAGLSTFTDRVFDITTHKRKKFLKLKNSVENRFSSDAIIDTDDWASYEAQYHKDCKKLTTMRDGYKSYKKNLRDGLERLEQIFPEQTLYPFVSPKGKAYFAIDINGTKKLVAPMRTWQEQNPIENPKSIRISFADLKKITSRLEWLEAIEGVKSSVKKIFHI